MKKVIIVFSIILGLCWIGGCSLPLQYIAGQLEPKLEEDWAKKSGLKEKMLFRDKVLLSSEQKNEASRRICNLEHLNKRKSNNTQVEWTKAFCRLQPMDKIYYLKDYNNGVGLIQTHYLLLRDNIPIESVSIETKYSKELSKPISIIERLH